MQEYSVEKPFLNFEAIKNKTGIPSEIIEKTKLFLYQPVDSKHGEQSTSLYFKKVAFRLYLHLIPLYIL